RHLGFALEVDLFGGERRLGLCLALDLELHFRKLDVLHRLFEFRLAPVGHGPAPPLPEAIKIVCRTVDASAPQCGGMGIQTGGFPENRMRLNTTSSATSNGFRYT